MLAMAVFDPAVEQQMGIAPPLRSARRSLVRKARRLWLEQPGIELAATAAARLSQPKASLAAPMPTALAKSSSFTGA